MVDARLKGEWLDAIRFFELSDAAWRLFTNALMWCNNQGTDGAIGVRYIDRLHPDGPQPTAVAELEAKGVWRRVGDSYQMSSWEDELGQSTAEQIRQYREGAARRSAAYRARKTRDVTRDATSDVGTGTGSSPVPKPGAYATRDVTRDGLVCSKHPSGDTGEPCAQCAAIRQARSAKPTHAPRAAKLGDGHDHHPDQWGNCPLCGEKAA